MKKAKAASKMEHSERSEVPEKLPPKNERRQLKKAPQVPERKIVTRSLTKRDDKARFDQFLDGTQVHPLLIGNIVDMIIEYVVWSTSADPYSTPEQKTKDFRNIRLVCKTWSEQGTKLYLKNCNPEMEFGGPYDDPCFCQYDLKLEKFLNDMHYTRAIPVQRYSFDPTFFTIENYSIFKRFMLTLGPTIVELQIYFDSHSYMTFDKKSFETLDLSQLKVLLIELGGLLTYPYLLRRTHNIIVEAILKSTRILETFRFRIPETDTASEAELRELQGETFQRLREAVMKNIPPTVKNLYIDIPGIE